MERELQPKDEWGTAVAELLAFGDNKAVVEREVNGSL